MDRLVDRTYTFRQRASEYICKMLFSRPPAPVLVPRGSPWFAWLTTLAILWSFRRPIVRTVMSLPPLNTMKKKHKKVSRMHSSGYISCSDELSKASRALQVTRIPKYRPIIYKKHNSAGVKTRVKRLCSGDGLPVSSSSSSSIERHQISYKVTRSGKVYGKYHNEEIHQQRGMLNPTVLRPLRPSPTFYRRKYSKFIKTSPEFEEGRRSNSHIGDKDQIGYAAKFL